MLSFLGESEYYRRVVCRASIFGFSLVANKNREVSFMHSLYLLKFCLQGFPFQAHVNLGKKYPGLESWEFSQGGFVLTGCVRRGRRGNQDDVSVLVKAISSLMSQKLLY